MKINIIGSCTKSSTYIGASKSILIHIRVVFDDTQAGCMQLLVNQTKLPI
jgi:hypothetical protein